MASRPAVQPAVDPAAPPPAKPSVLKRCLWGGLLLVLLYGIHRFDSRQQEPWISVALVVLFGLVGAVEYHLLLRNRCHAWLGVLFIGLLLFGKAATLLFGGDARLVTEACLLGLLICLFVIEVWAGEPQAGPPRMAATLGGFCYFLLFSYLLDLLVLPTSPPLGLPLAFLLVLTAKSTDIGGYLVGNLVGGRKLAPRVSPGKTRSGAVGGLALSLLVAGYGGLLVAPDRHTYWWLLFGLLVGLASLFGDLGESLLKRFVGRKDSAALVPTFGGALDMLDSLVLAAPVGYWYLNSGFVVNLW